MNFDFNFNGADIDAYPDQPVVHQDDAVQAPHFRTMLPPSEAHVPSPAMSFANLLLSQDIEQQPLNDAEKEIPINQNREEPRKHKRTRLLLDARTELTDDELKVQFFSCSNSSHRFHFGPKDCQSQVSPVSECHQTRYAREKDGERTR